MARPRESLGAVRPAHPAPHPRQRNRQRSRRRESRQRTSRRSPARRTPGYPMRAGFGRRQCCRRMAGVTNETSSRNAIIGASDAKCFAWSHIGVPARPTPRKFRPLPANLEFNLSVDLAGCRMQRVRRFHCGKAGARVAVVMRRHGVCIVSHMRSSASVAPVSAILRKPQPGSPCTCSS